MRINAKYIFGSALAASMLSGCKRLDTIDYAPHVTPDAFLAAQPWMRATLFGHEFILTQPTSTIIVYFVGLFTIYAGFRFLSDIQGQRSRLLWGIGLVLTGLGALAAGTSFQMLGYEIKCAGREYCTYTSWWEVIYMLLSLPGLNAFLCASAYSNTTSYYRKSIISYACINTVIYCTLLLYGAFAPVKVFVSFEFFVMMGMPGVFFLLWLHSSDFRKDRDLMDLRLTIAWLIFMAVTVSYVTYMMLGVTQVLWSRGIWFSENDVLHTGLIIWVLYLLARVRGVVRDMA